MCTRFLYHCKFLAFSCWASLIPGVELIIRGCSRRIFRETGGESFLAWLGGEVTPLPLLIGPSHMSFYVRTHKGSTLSQWSLGNGTPVTSKGGDYFVFYSHGLRASAWQFWIEVQVRISQLCCRDWSGSAVASGIIILPS